MTLDEAIKDLEYGSNQLEMEIESGLWIEGSESELSCKEGIALTKQYIEWLKELKELRSIVDACNILAVDAFAVEKLCKELREAKRLLKLAVEGYSFIGHITKNYTCPSFTSCSACPMDEGRQCRVWGHADEALALIGEDGDANE